MKNNYDNAFQIIEKLKPNIKHLLGIAEEKLEIKYEKSTNYTIKNVQYLAEKLDKELPKATIGDFVNKCKHLNDSIKNKTLYTRTKEVKAHLQTLAYHLNQDRQKTKITR